MTELEDVETVSTEALAVIGIVAYLDPATRRQIEATTGEDAESMLARLVRRRLLTVTFRDGRNLYRVAARGIAASGCASLAELRQYTQSVHDREEHTTPDPRCPLCDRRCQTTAARYTLGNEGGQQEDDDHGGDQGPGDG
jgi:hypothetical protein